MSQLTPPEIKALARRITELVRRGNKRRKRQAWLRRSGIVTPGMQAELAYHEEVAIASRIELRACAEALRKAQEDNNKEKTK